MLKVLGRASSINVQKVMWFSAELGLDVERADIGGKYGGNDTPEYLAKNPNGLVPILEDGDFVLWESQAIVRYLAEKYGKAPWYPADVEGRGLANQWMDWYLTRLHAPMTVIFLGLIRTAPEDRDLSAMDKAAKQAADLWALIDGHLENSDFMTGAEPTMGDVPLGCAVNRWHTLDVERPNLPRLEAYYQRLQERPHFREHVMVTME
ncbi:MAG: glutathione S-transferase family protein [Rhodospirillales bacterium]|nr:glutathione S-transferase family protein [Rhodospirillales bacterium]